MLSVNVDFHEAVQVMHFHEAVLCETIVLLERINRDLETIVLL